MFKGPDHSYFHITLPTELNSTSEPINEVKDYINGCYLCVPEAAWQIIGFHLTNKIPSVRPLSIHLPGENIPQFLKKESASSLIRYFHRPLQLLFNKLSYWKTRRIGNTAGKHQNDETLTKERETESRKSV